MKSLEKHRTACGRFLNIGPRAQMHLAAHPDVLAHLPEAISKTHLPTDGLMLEREVPMGRVIGRGGLVKTPPIGMDSEALFALRHNRKFPSRIAPLGAVGAESSTVVLIAKPSASVLGEYELITAWIGVLARKEPWDPSISLREEFDECLRFWSTSALVFDDATMTSPIVSSWAEVLSAAGVVRAPEQAGLAPVPYMRAHAPK